MDFGIPCSFESIFRIAGFCHCYFQKATVKRKTIQQRSYFGGGCSVLMFFLTQPYKDEDCSLIKTELPCSEPGKPPAWRLCAGRPMEHDGRRMDARRLRSEAKLVEELGWCQAIYFFETKPKMGKDNNESFPVDSFWKGFRPPTVRHVFLQHQLAASWFLPPHSTKTFDDPCKIMSIFI